MESTTKEPFSEWCILELLGHRRLAGYVQDVEMFGARMVFLAGELLDWLECHAVAR